VPAFSGAARYQAQDSRPGPCLRRPKAPSPRRTHTRCNATPAARPYTSQHTKPHAVQAQTSTHLSPERAQAHGDGETARRQSGSRPFRARRDIDARGSRPGPCLRRPKAPSPRRTHTWWTLHPTHAHSHISTPSRTRIQTQTSKHLSPERTQAHGEEETGSKTAQGTERREGDKTVSTAEALRVPETWRLGELRWRR